MKVDIDIILIYLSFLPLSSLSNAIHKLFVIYYSIAVFVAAFQDLLDILKLKNLAWF